MSIKASESCNRIDSVSSSSRQPGFRPKRLKAEPISSSRSPRRNCTAERFTDTTKRGKPAACQSIIWRQASFSTHSPISTISPDCSASQMNRSGGTMPNTGCCQRIKASAASRRPLWMSTIGW
ncbi:hypothetical protein D3C84_960410 [compost metagenome]